MNKYFRGALGVLLSVGAATAMVSCDDNDDPKPVVIPSDNTVYVGKTVTYPKEDPEKVFESTRGTYSIEYDESDNTAVLNINNASFLQGMPELGVMSFTGIAWKADNANKGFMLQKDALTPEIAGRPFPAFPISDFTAFEIPGESLEIKFICDYRNTPYVVTFEGTPEE